MTELDDRFTFDKTGTINGVKIYVYAPHGFMLSTDVLNELRDYLANKVDDFFAEKDGDKK